MEFTLPLGDTLYWAGSIILMVLVSPVGLVLAVGAVLLFGMKRLRS
jgi:hypothetical protein